MMDGARECSIRRGPLVGVHTVEVRFIKDSERPALLQMLTSSEDFPQNLLTFYRPGRSHYEALGAWSAGEVLGVLTGSFDSNFFESGAFDSFDPPAAPHAFLDRVHVHESARGVGVGRALVTAYAREAAERACTFIGGQLDLSSDSSARRAFFEQLGFSIRDLDNFGATPAYVLSTS